MAQLRISSFFNQQNIKRKRERDEGEGVECKHVKLKGIKSEEVDMPYWKYIPRYLPKSTFYELYDEIKPFLQKYYMITEYGDVLSKRRSTVLTDVDKEQDGDDEYGNLKAWPWSTSPIVCHIRDKLSQDFGLTFDLVLIHEYPDGNACINWHSDREALHSPIVSVSLGEDRKFRLRKNETKEGWDYEYVLQSGDVIIMKTGCQQRFKHTVPIESKVKEPRLNLTFRKRDQQL